MNSTQPEPTNPPKTYTTAQIVAESLRRAYGEPTMPDEDFEEAVNSWASSLPPRTEPYTLKDLHEAAKRLRSGIFAVEPNLRKPYPDDPRWTPYTRFVEPALSNLSHVIEQLVIQEAKVQPAPSNLSQGEDTELDAILGICATYGTLVLGTPDQEHFIAGFKASKTYKEAIAALQARDARIVREAEERGRNDGWDANRQNAIFWFRDLANKIDYYQSSGASDEDTIKGIQQWLDDQDRRLQFVQLTPPQTKPEEAK